MSPRYAAPRAALGAGVVLAAVLFAYGAWQRRWISDDGLIVLRTVRNILAGNGPVFNADERVEANTSTLWTYIVTFVGWVTGAQLEYVVLTLALAFSVLAVVLAMLGTARLYGQTLFGRPASAVLLVPAGVIAYLAVPPARDFATSGLESGLVLAWIALMWWLLVRWSFAERHGSGLTLAIAFVAGLGPLVRPELAMLGGLALILLLVLPSRLRLRVAIVVVAGAVPVAYQVFRMGYYALPYPSTAVAKDAGGARWDKGWMYLGDLAGPYWLWLPLVLLAVLALAALVLFRGADGNSRDTETAADPDHGDPSGITAAARRRSWRSRLQSPAVVVGFFLFNGVLLGLYVVRVGGDFMHGRTLLPVLFTLLLPVAVVPLTAPRRVRTRTGGSRRHYGYRVSGVLGALWLAVMVWSGVIVVVSDPGVVDGVPDHGIVDERQFYRYWTNVAHPILAEDYIEYPRMESMLDALTRAPHGALLLPTADMNYWAIVPPASRPGNSRIAAAPESTVYFLQLGMTSMLTSLDVRILDPVGLAYPLAGHTERIPGGRIGHDKYLLPDWVVVDTGAATTREAGLPGFLDPEWVADSQEALTCPQTQRLLSGYRNELNAGQFVRNFRDALWRSSYRIERLPQDEIERCSARNGA
ncbi:flagellar motor control protein ZomB [Hoyosella sp. YIM 151337]|uniref:flagellar motor control protein ZomB n=1 Tax=Hoyosella sp. YIM 151337 TaxID=2992742 RepID=UPI002235FB3B|nr:flagellar motor control protein ZomB [Hoyosella sp. YIM 151337]